MIAIAYGVAAFVALVLLLAWREAVRVIPEIEALNVHLRTCSYCDSMINYRCTDARKMIAAVPTRVPPPLPFLVAAAVAWPLTLTVVLANAGAHRFAAPIRRAVLLREQERRDAAEVDKIVSGL